MGPLSLFRLVRIPLSLGATDGSECVCGAGVGCCLWVAGAGVSSEILWAGRSRPCALAEAGGDELRCAGQLVGLAVFSGAHAVAAHDVCGQAQAGFAALVADEPPLFVLCDASVDPGSDWLTDAGCGLVRVLASRPLVVHEAETV